VLLDKLRDVETRLWYAQECVKQGWSRSILAMQIERRLHERQGKALNNFAHTLPPPTSELAAQLFKDPYLFDMLGTADPSLSLRGGTR
jgi:predicted nuclease of restriction endonuclease-like (RecB) superfamily